MSINSGQMVMNIIIQSIVHETNLWAVFDIVTIESDDHIGKKLTVTKGC